MQTLKWANFVKFSRQTTLKARLVTGSDTQLSRDEDTQTPVNRLFPVVKGLVSSLRLGADKAQVEPASSVKQEVSVEKDARVTSENKRESKTTNDSVGSDLAFSGSSGSYASTLEEQHNCVTDFMKSRETDVTVRKKNSSKIFVGNLKKTTEASPVSSTSDASPVGITESVSRALPAAVKVVREIFVSEEQSNDNSNASKPKGKLFSASSNNVSRASVDARTRGLCQSIRAAESNMSRRQRTEELVRHLLRHPSSRGVVWEEKLIGRLKSFCHSSDNALRDQANELLSLVGYTDNLSSRGIRLLSLDGGGSRGLASLHMLRALEKQTGRRVQDMFDMVCGVSTGAMMGCMLFAFQLSVEDTMDMYLEYTKQMFTRNRLVGAGKLIATQAYYDTEIWTNILKSNFGEKALLTTARNPKMPKLMCVACVMNKNKLENYLFRNYNLHPSRPSPYDGTCAPRLWEAVRASTAAPGYYENFKLGEYVLHDGGLITNNPTFLALHEARLLWPNERLQCVVSLGTGRYEVPHDVSDKVSVKDKIVKIVDAVTGTEVTHTMLHELLPRPVYFRFNPYTSEQYTLDEVRPDKVDQLLYDTRMYLRRNQLKMDRLVRELNRGRQLQQRLKDKLFLHN